MVCPNYILGLRDAVPRHHAQHPASCHRLLARATPCYTHHMAKLSPIESEFETTEEAEAYDAWFRAKVEKAMTSTEPGIPHDQVMAMVQEILEQHRPR